jgi:hypothetical protein
MALIYPLAFKRQEPALPTMLSRCVALGIFCFWRFANCCGVVVSGLGLTEEKMRS